jgi:inner membrane protein
VASPIAHTLAGATIYLWSTRPDQERVWKIFRQHWRLLALFAILAYLPDGDFILGWLTTGDPNAYHHGWTHSISVAAGAALLTALVIKIRPGFAVNWLWYFAAVGSHLVIDFFTGPELGMQRAYGMPLLWPFSAEIFQSPISLVVGPKHHEVVHLFSLHNWVWGAYEAAIFGTILLLTIKLRKNQDA